MKKLIFPVLLATMPLIPATAIAESEFVTANIKYDATLLATSEGAGLVIESVKAQAHRACSSRSSVSNMPYTDTDCVKTMVSSATKQILTATEEAGLPVAPEFARNAVTLVADAGQR